MHRLLLLLLLPAFALWQPTRLAEPAEQPKHPVLYGVDVSHYQKRIQWDTVVAKEQLHFAFVKATEGHDYSDSLFCNNWEALERLGIVRGAYHFFRAYGCGEEQAMHFLRTVEMRPGDLAPVLDIERTDGIDPELMRQEAAIWLQMVEEHLGVRPIIYSNQHFYEQYLAGHFDHYPLWIARYSEEQPCLDSGKEWCIWQYSNKGCIEGIPAKVDVNIFPGTPAMLSELCWKPGVNAAGVSAQP
ncbi:MAG TPA: GH25 family lysozyme [Saprospiraceae bacterium]|nr:GH25 family lysozyme [Saprospiraceae bacterium]HND88033.1 GH25 family lysozyme [Saprospiraceae bacterium]HNG89948.1 GH25 family lysozyme [Saprospiraceae bacterium]